MIVHPRYGWSAALVGVVGIIALGSGPISSLRPVPPELRTDRTLVVTTSRDAGPGSLREAIFSAARSGQSVRILLVTTRIALQSPLPAIVGTRSVVLDAQRSHCRIDARAIGLAPALDIAAPQSVVTGLSIEHAAGDALLIRAPGVHVDGVHITDSQQGIDFAETARGGSVENSTFEKNGKGVAFARSALPATVRGNHFQRHDQAAVWAVSDRAGSEGDGQLRVSGNVMEGDRIGVVSINLSSRIEHNQFVHERDAALYLMGRGAEVRENRVRNGGSAGIFADATDGALLEANEIDHNAAGLLVRSARGTIARRNRLYANAYGVVVVFGEAATNLFVDNIANSQSYDGFYVVGAAPTLRNNIASGNRQAALRIFDFLPRHGPVIAAAPILQGNRFGRNLLNDPVRGLYRAVDEDHRR